MCGPHVCMHQSFNLQVGARLCQQETHWLQINKNSVTSPIFLLPSGGENKEERRKLQYSTTASSAVNPPSGHPRNTRNCIREQAVFEITRTSSKGPGYFLSRPGTSWQDMWVPRGTIQEQDHFLLLKRGKGWGGNSSRSGILRALAAAEEEAESGRQVEEAGEAAAQKKVSEPVSQPPRSTGQRTAPEARFTNLRSQVSELPGRVGAVLCPLPSVGGDKGLLGRWDWASRGTRLRYGWLTALPRGRGRGWAALPGGSGVPQPGQLSQTEVGIRGKKMGTCVPFHPRVLARSCQVGGGLCFRD